MIKNGEETKISNPVVDNFEFQVSHEIQCQTCGNTISNNEEYNNLCLELPEKLQNSLDNEKKKYFSRRAKLYAEKNFDFILNMFSNQL
ncbi:ubiquitin carboxyl-terminal hydrolase 37-like [Brachionus plicatilis]|uniref:Ubiquitin carboxyl-terminal hydrolase 37-like n=1 Tax=Brachionus plicatilis TaxID=10195 RepID=A0A3M7RFK2_BRAPC|nr:ubiquitin carboxyl-terminal hydrolase 37-like [Brachionus plicatilis]